MKLCAELAARDRIDRREQIKLGVTIDLGRL
jgi:hypothetical protein